MERTPYRWGKASAPDPGDVIELRGSSDHAELADAVRELDRRERSRSSDRRSAASALLAGFDPSRGSCSLAHMGDARAYLFRPAPLRRDLPVPLAPRYCPELIGDAGSMVCVTWDHSTACDLVEMEMIGVRDGRRRARRRVLTRGLGVDPPAEPDLLVVALEPGDRLLLCSAGLWLAIADDEIAELLAAESDPDAACRALVARATDAGAPHPPSALLVDWTGAPARDTAPPPAALPAPLAGLGRDLTALAEGDRSPNTGRKRELRSLIRTLLRMQKPNALLVGDPGVGKTWLVQALARTLASPACPPPLAGARVLEISMAGLLAGTRYRGDFEERLQQLIEAAEADRSIILFIDEIHLLAGAGASAEGGVDAANILKPALARGAMRVIGATTGAELDRHLVRDEALMRRFELIRIEEPSRADALSILSAVADRLEAHHGSAITAEAREAAIDLSVRYLPDRRLPDKAIDLLDQACTRAVSRWLSMSIAPASAPATGSDQTVGPDDVAAVVADRCQLPLELVSLDDDQRLAALPDLLADRVLGQPTAIDTVARALQRGYRGLAEPGRPIASLLFCGPTGVGKTSLARAIAELLFDSAAALVRIDMSEYMERHSVSRLLGAAPGYVGHDRDGLLISALRARPASVVLFDEIEKAHPDVLQILLQILDAGWLKGSRGQSVSFRDSVVVLTSNLLADDEPTAAPIGFGNSAAPTAGDDESAVRRRLEQSLPPELIGRIGSVVRFAPLGADTIRAIADRHLARIVERLIASGTIKVPPRELRDRVAALTESGRYGARTIERAVEREVDAWLDSRARPVVGPGEVVLDRAARDEVTGAIAVVPTDDVAAAIERLRTGPASADLLYLVHAGIGALAIFGSVACASTAAEALDRAVIHWGRATREGPTFRGPEIDRALELARAAAPGVTLTPAAREHT